jgi:hypothetical protein
MQMDIVHLLQWMLPQANGHCLFALRDVTASKWTVSVCFAGRGCLQMKVDHLVNGMSRKLTDIVRLLKRFVAASKRAVRLLSGCGPKQMDLSVCLA